MLVYLIRRLLYVVPIALAVSVVCFSLVHIAPGDPLVSVLPPDASQNLVEQMRKSYGFDRPLPVQFGIWIGKAIQGDFGTSIATSRPVSQEIYKAVGNTLMLAMAATLIGFTLGCFFGFVAGYFRDTWIDRVAVTVSILGVSVPHYWLGMVLVICFSVLLPWLPPTGAGPGSSADWIWNWEHVQYLILPACTMSVIPMGIVTRTVRALVGDILSQEFVDALRAKGLTDWGVFCHVVKNAAPTALTVIGLQLGYLLGGSILVEMVFNWPGLGRLLVDAVEMRDYPVIQAEVLLFSLEFILINLIVDILYAVINPTIRYR